jgi:hypothetical protein
MAVDLTLTNGQSAQSAPEHVRDIVYAVWGEAENQAVEEGVVPLSIYESTGPAAISYTAPAKYRVKIINAPTGPVIYLRQSINKFGETLNIEH